MNPYKKLSKVSDLGVRCGEGWAPIILKLHEDLLKIDPDYSLQQIKEKFGGLRFYAVFSNKETHDAAQVLIRNAEKECDKTCEECGAPGKISRRGCWLQTLCKDCFLAWSSEKPESKAFFDVKGFET